MSVVSILLLFCFYWIASPISLWIEFKKTEIPNGQNFIKNKWIFKTKQNGISVPYELNQP